MREAPHRFVLQEDHDCQARLARNMSGELVAAIRRICERNPSVLACFLLEIRRKPSDAINLAIAVSLQDEATQIDQAVAEFQQMLQEFQEVAQRTTMLSSKPFRSLYSGSEFYVKPQR